jgi:uncharacterized RDD family membrane protein YckC
MTGKEIQVPAGLTTEGLLGRRYGARCIDSIVLILLIRAAQVLVFGRLLLVGGEGWPTNAIAAVLAFVLTLGYFTVQESSAAQATLGKRLMTLRVYDAQGGRLSLAQAAGRNLVKDGPFFVLGPFGLLWLVAHLVVMHRSPVYQAIHDRVAHTWVAAPDEVTQLRLS